MENVAFIKVENPNTNEVVEHAIITHSEGVFTTMLKSTWDAQQAAQEAQSL